MKNLLVTTVVFLAIASSWSCKQIPIEAMQPTVSNPLLLPALEPLVDMRSFKQTYSNQGVILEEFGNGWGTGYSVVSYGNNFDIRVRDAITLFDREIKQNVSNGLGERYGYARCRITNSVISDPGLPLAWLSAGSGFLLNVLGMPGNINKTNLELQVEILDSNQKVIGRYIAHAAAKGTTALYYGYTLPDARRMSNSKAFKKAMLSIKDQIARDYERLNNDLLAAGPRVGRGSLK